MKGNRDKKRRDFEEPVASSPNNNNKKVKKMQKVRDEEEEEEAVVIQLNLILDSFLDGGTLSRRSSNSNVSSWPRLWFNDRFKFDMFTDLLFKGDNEER